jgi:hypothetical protein
LVYDSTTGREYEPEEPAALWNSATMKQVCAVAAAAAAAAEAKQLRQASMFAKHSPANNDRSSFHSEGTTDSDNGSSAQQREPLVTKPSDAHLLAVSADKRQCLWAVRH